MLCGFSYGRPDVEGCRWFISLLDQMADVLALELDHRATTVHDDSDSDSDTDVWDGHYMTRNYLHLLVKYHRDVLPNDLLVHLSRSLGEIDTFPRDPALQPAARSKLLTKLLDKLATGWVTVWDIDDEDDARVISSVLKSEEDYPSYFVEYMRVLVRLSGKASPPQRTRP
jgi:hypothetical protein